jgi:hypothetical protein
MNKQKLEAKVLAAVQDELRPDETVEVVTQAFKDLGAAVKLPILALTGQLEARRYGVVLTDRRLVLVGTNRLTAKMVGITAEYPRASMRALTAPKGAFRAFEVGDSNGIRIATLSFPAPNRPEGEQIAAALTRA